MGLMGKTTEEEEEADWRRYERSPEYKKMRKTEEENEKRREEMMRKKDMEKHMVAYRAQGAEEYRKNKEKEALEFKEKQAQGLIYRNGKWVHPVVNNRRERQDWPYGG
jgi:hypothetical protein